MNRVVLDELLALLKAEGLTPTSSQLHSDDGAHSEAIHTLQLAIQGRHGSWACTIRLFEQTQRLVVYSQMAEAVPESERVRLALMLTRINYGLVLGNFELDLDDGELRYKTSLVAEAMPLNATIVRNLVYGNFFGLDLYIRALQAALADPQADTIALIAEAEGTSTGTALDFSAPTATEQ